MLFFCQRAKFVFPAAPKTFFSQYLTAAIIIVLLGGAQGSEARTALDDYLSNGDTTYEFTLQGTLSGPDNNAIPGPDYTGYQIDLTSQTWRDSSEITRSQWEHKMTIAVPDTLALNPAKNTAILIIDGGDNPGHFDPLDADSLLTRAALLTHSVVVEVPTIPNQPLQFTEEGIDREEDAIIAKTFAKFLDGGDSDWPLLLPMVKSAVRAMDATQAQMASQGVTIDNFFVIGGSKRGWTTWLTAAADDRVTAIVPGVIDLLNLDESMAHHHRVYQEGPVQAPGASLAGGYSLAVRDYVAENIIERFSTPRGQELLAIVDPYEYRDRLDMPKYIINSTGDEFFVPDSSQFYFDDLIGQKYLRYVPNTSHKLSDEAVEGAFVFFNAVAQGVTLPEFTWEIADDGASITVNTTLGSPVEVLVWEATNLANRDFRKATFGDLQGGMWTSSPLADQGSGQYVASVTPPSTGATAFMVELTYDIGGVPLIFTTEVSVAQIPEPASIALLILGVTVVSVSRRRNRVSYK